MSQSFQEIMLRSYLFIYLFNLLFYEKINKIKHQML